VTDKLLAAGSHPLFEGQGKVSRESVEALVDERWPGFVADRRQRERDESWQVEAADITDLLQFEQRRNDDPSRGSRGDEAARR
jgi:hypothetical protein